MVWRRGATIREGEDLSLVGWDIENCQVRRGIPFAVQQDLNSTGIALNHVPGFIVAGLTQYRAYFTDEVMALLLQSNKNRTTEPTHVNETPSRSHAVLQVKL